MRIIIVLIVFSSIFSSCLIYEIASIASTTTFIQIYETASENVKLEANRFFFEDENVIVTYNLWAKKGILDFQIYNKTTAPIYFDWKNSNFIRQGESFNYWQDVKKLSGESKFNMKYYLNERKRPSEQLPPKSTIYIKKFYLRIGEEYGWKFLSKIKNNIITHEFNKTNSPLNFRNYIAYSIDKNFDELIFIDNDFWIRKKQIMKNKTFNRNLKSEINKKNKFYDVYLSNW